MLVPGHQPIAIVAPSTAWKAHIVAITARRTRAVHNGRNSSSGPHSSRAIVRWVPTSSSRGYASRAEDHGWVKISPLRAYQPAVPSPCQGSPVLSAHVAR
jgi:hypothetical protein